MKGARFGLMFSSACFLFAFNTFRVSKSCLAFIGMSVGGQDKKNWSPPQFPLKQQGDKWLTLSLFFFLQAFCQKLELNVLATAKQNGIFTQSD